MSLEVVMGSPRTCSGLAKSGDTVFVHKNVSGLQIAMDHQVLVGILHRRTHRSKQLQPVRY